MSAKWKFAFLFLFLYAFHTFFGLAQAQWWEQDQLQTYLIGLKFATTGAWPFFGPDVNGIENQSFQSQIPGALEGLAIGLPLKLLPIPEAPYLFLNLLTTLGAALLAWYITQRIPRLSFPWLFLWICVTPWTLHKAAHIINPAYDFLPTVLFFIGFMETLPVFSLNLWPPLWSNAAMGFSLLWIMQFHFSYVYLVPLAGFSLAAQTFNNISTAKAPTPPRAAKNKGTGTVFEGSSILFSWRLGGEPIFFFILGSLPAAVFLIPTFLQYGLGRTNVASGFTVPFNWYNVTEGFTILARYLSLVCFELPRFIGISTVTRKAFLLEHPWILAPGVLLWFAGIGQALVLFGFGLFKNRHPVPGWGPMRLLILGIYLMVWASFWFTIKLPLSHIYLVFYPWLMLYSCYVWSLFAERTWGPWAAKVFLGIALYFQMGYALAVLPHDSFYSQRPEVAAIRRDVVVRALKERDYRVLGQRRPGSLY